MAKGVLIIGESGSGKSTSLENLNPKETFVINVKNKTLPWRGSSKQYSLENKNYFQSDQSAIVVSTLKNISEKATHIKTIIIDDSQYIAADEFISKVSEKGYEKFNVLAKNVYNIIDIVTTLRDDLIVYYLWHSEVIMDGGEVRKIKAKTIGKMLDQYLTVEGMFTYVLFTEVEKTKDGMKYWFVTNTDGITTAKTPKGMLEYKIPNDLSLVNKAINEYNNIVEIKKEKVVA